MYVHLAMLDTIYSILPEISLRAYRKQIRAPAPTALHSKATIARSLLEKNSASGAIKGTRKMEMSAEKFVRVKTVLQWPWALKVAFGRQDTMSAHRVTKGFIDPLTAATPAQAPHFNLTTLFPEKSAHPTPPARRRK